MTTTPHYIPGIDPVTGMVGAPGCSMIRYFKVTSVAEMNAIADELDGDFCYITGGDTRFGKTDVGASWVQAAANYNQGSVFTLPAGTVNKLSIYMDGNSGAGGTATVKAVIYNTSGGNPTTLVAASAEVTIPSGQAAGWIDFTFASPPTLAGGDYYLGLIAGQSASRYAYTVEANAVKYCVDTYSDGPVSTFPAATLDHRRMSVYATYASAVGANALFISAGGSWKQMAGSGGVPAIAFGTRAARPGASAAGLQYFAYDQAASYVDSGSAWVRISTPAGVTGHFDGTLAPIGWVLRDGTSYDKTDPLYTDLFNAIGYTHGGSGNNFNVSDARGRASVARSAADTEFDVVGEKFGEKAHVNTLAETASHDHGPGTLRHLNPTRQGIAGSNQWVYVFDNWDNVTQVSFPLAATGATGLAGGNAAHNNIQPSIVGLGIVKL